MRAIQLRILLETIQTNQKLLITDNGKELFLIEKKGIKWYIMTNIENTFKIQNLRLQKDFKDVLYNQEAQIKINENRQILEFIGHNIILNIEEYFNEKKNYNNYFR